MPSGAVSYQSGDAFSKLVSMNSRAAPIGSEFPRISGTPNSDAEAGIVVVRSKDEGPTVRYACIESKNRDQ